MKAEAPPRCLDLSRLVSRVGRGPLTGIDRVERAYLDRLLAEPAPLFSLVRMKLSYALLDRDGTAALAERLAGNTGWGAPDMRARLTPGLTPTQRRLEADLRRLALETCPRPRLGGLLSRHLPPGTRYLNMGHSNLTRRVLGAMAGQGAEITVLIHDMIPLDHPEFQREGRVEVFEAAMRRVSQSATRVIYNSHHSRERGAHWFGLFGRVPPCEVAHLGIDRLEPDTTEVPVIIPPDRPCFVATGTLEGRKNHGLLLDAWTHLARMEEQTPTLLLIGSRGWRNEEFLSRLDASPQLGSDIFELEGLSDGAVAALTERAIAALFPSHAEGYGLPPAEALALGTPALVNTLPVYREFLGDLPVYLDGADSYQWAKTIHEMATKGWAETRIPREDVQLPTWDAHFNEVLKVT